MTTIAELQDHRMQPLDVQRPRDFRADLVSPDPDVRRAAAAGLVVEVTRAVRGLRRRVGLSEADAEDAIGETLLELVKRVGQGHPVPGAVVQRIATAVCSRFVNGPVRHETAKALRILKERVAEAEAAAGRSLSRAAVAALAEEVRLGPDFSPRHRPVERFHLVEGFTKPTSIDQHYADFIDAAALRSGAVLERGYAGAAGACDQLLDEFDLGLSTRAALRVEIWAAVAADEDLPIAVAGRIERRVAADLRAYVVGLPDGILTACRDHLEGRRSRATVALFAPFADPGEQGEDAIARYLSSRATFATRLWDSALVLATSRSSTVQAEREPERVGVFACAVSAEG
ncbi:MAG: hypothetical protein ACRDT9_13980 [Agromyces sp.]